MSQSIPNSEYRVRVGRKALTLAVTAALVTQVQAQQGGQDENAGALEEVIVTAAKREQSVQDLSISVTAIGMEQLETAEITDVSRLDTLVPGLQFASSGNEVRLALRGTRQNNVGTEAEQAVGIFEDGVYVPTSTQAMGSYLDINRIEVLRGPQGTLYGRNTFGGTINIITNDPHTDGLEGTVTALYGDYDRVKLEGVANIPLSDSFAIRVAALTDEHDGYIINTWLPGTSDDLNDRDDTVVRLGAKWFINDDVTAKFKVTSSDRKSNGNAIWGYQQIGGYRDGQLFHGHQYAPSDASDNFDEGPHRVARDQRSNADIDNTAYTLSLDWDFPDFATFRFIGNMTDMDGQQNYDSDYSDGGDNANNGFTGWDSSQDTWSVELQLVSNTDGRVDWMAGLYYYDQTANWNWLALENGEYVVPHWDNQGDYLSDSVGAFANATFHLSDQTRLIGGLRYAEDTKKQRDQLDWNVWPPAPIPNSGNEGEWDKTLWKAGFEYDLNDDMMTYASAANGYRAGGINFVADGVPLTYDPEEVVAFEAGLKSTLLDGAMTLNLAAYYNDFKDMQAQSFVTGASGGVAEYTENGGEVDVYGLEAEMNWVPGGDSNWNIGAQLSLMNAEFGEYSISKIFGVGDLGGRQDLDNPDAPLLSLRGMTPAISPEFTIGTQVSYDFELANNSIITPYVQLYHSDDYYGFDLNMPGNNQDSFTRWDLRLMWDSPTGVFHVNAFVLNASDEEVFNRALIFNPGSDPELGSIQTNWANPRTWGVSVRYNF
jgi:outer membrane receptor protein involved in Fe transport